MSEFLILSLIFPMSGTMTQLTLEHSNSSSTAVGCAAAGVLVVDDDGHFRQLARCLLECEGIRVLEAEGGHKAIDCLKAHERDIDCVIVDLVLPDDDGMEVIRQIKSDLPGAKIIAVSGVATAALDLRISRHLGADATLSKKEIELLPGLLENLLRS